MSRSIVTTDILDEKLDLEIGSIFSGCLAEIDSYNKSKRTAKVKPLAKIKTPKGLKNLPVVTLPVNTFSAGGMEFIPNYKKGDIVYLAPAMYPTSNQIKGQLETDTARRHKLENMIVAFGVKKQPSSLSVDKDGFVLTNGNLMYALFAENLIEFKIGSSNTEKSVLGETLKVKLDTLCDKVTAILDAIAALTVICSAPTTASSHPVNLTSFTAIKSEITTLKSELGNILSQNFKIN